MKLKEPISTYRIELNLEYKSESKANTSSILPPYTLSPSISLLLLSSLIPIDLFLYYNIS